MRKVPIEMMTVPPAKNGRRCLQTLAMVAAHSENEKSAVSAEPTRTERKRKKRFALRTEINMAIKAVRENGINIATVDLRPDGTIRLSSGLPNDPSDESEFDRWNKEGRL